MPLLRLTILVAGWLKSYLLTLRGSGRIMLLFGHVGITLGAAVLLAGGLSNTPFLKAMVNRASESTMSEIATASDDPPGQKASWLISLGNYIDLRFLLIGSLLPDIIDKPMGLFFFRETFGSGRIFCHTLLFLILLAAGGLYFYWRHRQTWLLALAYGTLAHLILDRIWGVPRTLLWPLYGFTFERTDVAHWIPNLLYALLTYPDVYIPELIGVIIMVWFTWTLLHRKAIYVFIRYGQIY